MLFENMKDWYDSDEGMGGMSDESDLDVDGMPNGELPTICL